MTAADQCPTAGKLEAFSSGRLDEADADAVAQHLSGCSRCVAGVQQIPTSDTLIDAFRAQTIVVQPAANPERVQRLIEAAKRLYEQPSLENRVPAREIDSLPQLQGFRLVKKLGQGGMGAVFEAEDVQLRRRAAIKVLLPERAADPSARARFLREARAMASLEHENIVPILLVNEDNGVPYFVMPLLAGETLEAKRRREGRLSLAEILRIGIAVAEGLDASHRLGIVHRDVKPENIWLETTGSRPLPDFQVKLLDFGLACNDQHDIRLTQEGMLIGTPAYMAPEQANGLPADARSDLFSLGTVLYVLASGQLPFAGPSSLAILRAVVDRAPTPLGELCPHLPKAFVAVVEKLHAKDPAQRFATAADVAAALRRLAESPAPATPPVAARRRSRGRQLLAAGLLLLGLGGLGICEAAGITHVTRSFNGNGEPGLPPRMVDASPIAGDSPQPGGAFATNGGSDAIHGIVSEVPDVFPVALLQFEERGTTGSAGKVADLLFAKMAGDPDLFLVDRNDLGKVMAEAALNLSGAVKSSEAAQIGQLTGAKLLVTGSVIHVDKKLILVAKVIGTETGRVAGASVEGKAADDLSDLAAQLAAKLSETIPKK